MKQLIIAIDYDDTFTADPGLFSAFVALAKRNHTVCIVTARRCTDENIEKLNADLDHWDCQMPIFFTSLQSKTEYMKKIGIDVNIWIDDNPHALLNGH